MESEKDVLYNKLLEAENYIDDLEQEKQSTREQRELLQTEIA